MKKMSYVKRTCICAVCIALCYVLPLAFHAFGAGTVQALEDAGFRVDIKAMPAAEFQSLPVAIADYLEKHNG